MVLEAVFEQIARSSGHELKVLDLCGAPGGKSTLMASFLDGKGLLVSNEVVPSRALILKENIIKWGAPNVVVTRSNPVDFKSLPGFFDVMVVDAPCSGEGMFRKGEIARQEWSEENTKICSARQRRILTDAWDALKENGWLIYSTCTFNPAENEENLQWLAKQVNMEVHPLPFPAAWGTRSMALLGGNAQAFYPHKARGEGFFVALIQKKESPARSNRHNVRKIKPSRPPAMADHLLPNPSAWHFVERGSVWSAVPRPYQYHFQELSERLNVIYSGLLLGSPGRKEWLPNHALAMSWLCREGFPQLALSKPEALRYLKGEALSPAPGMERGFYAVTSQGQSLGFVKNVGNRLNNLYPKEWRIRMNI